MKANRKFVQADEAVSPVIAVILMVAITVVLAATVFVLVSDIGGNTGKSAPTISFRQDDSLDRIVVDSAAAGADWNRLAVKLKATVTGSTSIRVGDAATTGNGATSFQNEAAVDATAGNTVTTSANREVTGANDGINAGDYIEICEEATTDVTDVTIIVIDTTANAQVGEYSFLTVAAC